MSDKELDERVLWERHIACRELRRRRVRLPDNEEQLDRAIALAYVSFFLLLAAAPDPGPVGLQHLYDFLAKALRARVKNRGMWLAPRMG